ncbi:hypothetical protein MLP_09090 [Microlunatus phosphovorus NM-1]|uniref:Uncharacterized protein n=1 Tax=Microlunatus phosphovorus (strain ATCC 700054 / DSM 10555 / JCM 9379 / NBRC 101784 / NCIMB 13414 / VKM Ac-1990 / NM-1) TaxID=1032480 RepID=F5XM44_MICPN|nr:hypothetical protein MLP_09090 [Microlunatus phosphovorus NM-1]
MVWSCRSPSRERTTPRRHRTVHQRLAGDVGCLPLAAVTGRADLLDAVQPDGLGGTCSGSPIACAAALASMDYLTEHDLPARAPVVS